MATLKEPIKLFIVQSLACYDTPQEVADLVMQEYGLEIDRRQCENYDPTKFAGRNLSPKLKTLFEETRKKFDEGLLDIPIAQKYFRLRQYEKFLKRTSSIPIGLKILEQAARDCGNQYTNKQEVDHTTEGESLNKPTTIELVAPHVKGTDTTTT